MEEARGSADYSGGEWEAELVAAAGVGHEITPGMWGRIDAFFDAHFEP